MPSRHEGQDSGKCRSLGQGTAAQGVQGVSRDFTLVPMNYAAPSQVSVDLLTSPGRGPNEAEALRQWVQVNEDAWRAGRDKTPGASLAAVS